MSFIIEEYRQADPIEINNRLGIAYDVQKSEFIIFFMGVNYHVSYPDFRVSHEETEMCFYPLKEDIYAKILVLRYLLNASVFPHNGDFRAYRELPSGELYYRQFQGRCIFRLNRKYGNRLEALYVYLLEYQSGKRVLELSYGGVKSAKNGLIVITPDFDNFTTKLIAADEYSNI